MLVTKVLITRHDDNLCMHLHIDAVNKGSVYNGVKMNQEMITKVKAFLVGSFNGISEKNYNLLKK